MLFHRLIDVTYNGGVFPATHDKINDPAANGDPGVPALADAPKLTTVGHPNEGTYYIGFAEDGLSAAGNRPHDALGQNTDFLDDICSGDVPVPAELEATAGGAISSLVITGDIFVGMFGVYTDTQPYRDRLIKVIDNSTGNDMVDNNGVKVECDRIRNTADTLNAIGVPVSGFETNPTVGFTPSIPNGRSYRIVYGKRSSLAAGIRSKADLDLLVRLAIRAAQQASAETIRFITQAARRTGGNITALSGTIIETPLNAVAPGGSILPKANTFTVDIDPDGTVVGTGSFNVRFSRDAVSQYPFRVIEITSGPAVWKAQGSNIALGDDNTAAAGFTNDYVPLSGGLAVDGDNSLRLFEVDPAVVGVPTSIFKRLNARWTVTVGDGSATFGDFNGVTAVTDAVAATMALGLTSLRIQVKPGYYEVDQLVFTGMTSVVIEGTSVSDCYLHNIATVGNPGILLRLNCKAYFRQLTFTSAGAGSTVIIKADGAILHVEDCVSNQTIEFVAQAGVALNQGATLHISRSVLFGGSIGNPPILISGGSGFSFAHHGFIFEDCLIDPHLFGSTPAVRLVDNGGTGAPYLSGILFNRCRFYLGDTTVTLGDMTGNSGVFEVVLGATNNLKVKDIEWRDCNVTVTGLADVKCLMMLQTGDGVGSVDFHKITISGGRWELPVADSDLAPFFIGGQTDKWDTSAPQEIVVKDVAWSFVAGYQDYGAAHTTYSAFGAGESAGFVLVANTVRMRRVKWFTTNALSTNGDLLVDAQVVDIDTLDFPTTMGSSGGGSSPNFRIKIVAVLQIASDADSRVANVKMRCGISGGATSAVWHVEASGPLLFDKCTADGFAGGTIHGFFVPAVNYRTRGIHFSECEMSGNSGTGFYYRHDGVQIDGLDDISFDGCTFNNNTLRGIHIGSLPTTVAPGLTRIINCRFMDNGNHGLLYDPGANNALLTRLIITGCYFKANNSSGDQISLGGYVLGSLLLGSIIGNDCVGDSIRFFGALGSILMLGCETGYDSSGLIITANEMRWVNTNQMLHNWATYAE